MPYAHDAEHDASMKDATPFVAFHDSPMFTDPASNFNATSPDSELQLFGDFDLDEYYNQYINLSDATSTSPWSPTAQGSFDLINSPPSGSSFSASPASFQEPSHLPPHDHQHQQAQQIESTQSASAMSPPAGAAMRDFDQDNLLLHWTPDAPLFVSPPSPPTHQQFPASAPIPIPTASGRPSQGDLSMWTDSSLYAHAQASHFASMSAPGPAGETAYMSPSLAPNDLALGFQDEQATLPAWATQLWPGQDMSRSTARPIAIPGTRGGSNVMGNSHLSPLAQQQGPMSMPLNYPLAPSTSTSPPAAAAGNPFLSSSYSTSHMSSLPFPISQPQHSTGLFQPSSAPAEPSMLRSGGLRAYSTRRTTHSHSSATSPLATTSAHRAQAHASNSRSSEVSPKRSPSPALDFPDSTATVRRKKRSMTSETIRSFPIPFGERAVSEGAKAPASSAAATPSKSELKPPKLAPSTWQLYFTDWIQRHQAKSDKKLNVAQAAKEAGIEYANLTPEQKEPFRRRSQAAKDARERELAAWQRTLTPEDIKKENAFRAAQRKAGKSRKGNIKDPNAPKKPLSAYFMFLQHIRSDPKLVHSVFGDERETTAQSVLAAKRWREMTDDDRKPFLAQAEKEKLEYEAARRMYEEGTPGFESTITFNVPVGHWSVGAGTGTDFVIGRPTSEVALSASEPEESEMESEGFSTD